MSDFKKHKSARVLYPYQERLHAEMAKLKLANSFVLRYLSVAPGGGKTLMGITLAVEEVLKNGGTVLWLAWDWILLEQAYETLKKQYAVPSHCLAFASASKPRGIIFANEIANLSKEAATPSLVFSTPRIWMNQVKSLGRSFRPTLIVVDEAHYGRGGVTDQELKAYYTRNRISILGLSGTPKKRRDWEIIRDPVHFKNLVLDGYLAEPRPASIRTGLRFDGQLVADKSDLASSGRMISQDTIRELAQDRLRNTMIVEYIKSHQLGKTIVFAGSKEHADILGAMLSSHGSVVIHEDFDDPKGLIHDFKKNHYRIAICVNMLKQGIDIPDVNSIVITMPTTSDIAYFQMACRGARTTPNKRSFNLIDVEDTFNNVNFRSLLVRPQDFFFGGSRARDTEVTNTTLLSNRRSSDVRAHNQTQTKHSYTNSGETFTFRYGSDRPLWQQRLSGLRIVTTQTFGVECELSHKKDNFDYSIKAHWIPIAEQLRQHISSVVGNKHCASHSLFNETDKNGIDYSKWNVVFDGSCGWEIVSPILLGQRGFEDLALVFDSFEKQDLFARLNLHVDPRTGLHIHMGWDYSTVDQTKRLVHAIRKFSPALYSLVASSRLNNLHCKSLKNHMTLTKLEEISSLREFSESWADHETRYHDVNFQGVRRRDRTFEVRMHSGTFDGVKISLWIALWMNLVHAVDRPHVGLNVDSAGGGRGIDFEPVPECDIIQICVKHLGLDSIHDRGFLEKLYARRLEIFANQHWREKVGNGTVNQMLDYWQKEYRKILPHS